MSGPDSTDRTAAMHAPLPRAETPEVRIRWARLTDVGLVRKNNEDSSAIADLAPSAGGDAPEAGEGQVGPKGVLLVVSDGMGGQEAGEVASRIAVDTLRSVLDAEWTRRPERDAEAELRNDLRTAVDRANRGVLDHAAENPSRAGMGATLTAAVVFGRRLLLSHVGDSRCYLLRGGLMKALTADQSLAEELVRRGVVERGSEAYAARRSVLTRVVGQKGRLEADAEGVDICRGDRILLCSDGLYGPVDHDAICDILGEASDPEGAAQELVAEAKRRGAPDNVTCIAAWLDGPGLPDPADDDGGGGTVSVAIDPALLDQSGESTLAFSGKRDDATAEFGAGEIADDAAPRSAPSTSAPGPAPPAPPAAVAPVGPSLYDSLTFTEDAPSSASGKEPSGAFLALAVIALIVGVVLCLAFLS